MSAFATKQKPPRQDLDTFTTNVFSSTDNQINISDVIGLQGSLSSKIGSADTITLTNKTIDGDDNTIQDLTIASTTNLQSTLDNKLEADDTATLTNKTISGSSNTLSNIAISSVSNLQSSLNNKISLNANYSTSGVGLHSNGLKLGSNSSSSFFLLKDTNAPSGYSVSAPPVNIPSTGLMLQDYNNNEFMFIDRMNNRISIGKEQEQNTQQKGISINTTGLNTWDDYNSTTVDLTMDDNSIVIASNTPVVGSTSSDGIQYPVRKRDNAVSGGGCYIKPIRVDSILKTMTLNNVKDFPEGQSSHYLVYNDRTGEIMKRANNTAMKYMNVIIGANNGDSFDGIDTTERNLPRLSVHPSNQTITFDWQARVSETGGNSNGGSFNNTTISGVFGGSLAIENSIMITSDERIKTDITDVDDASALEKLRLIQPKTYSYIDKQGRHGSKVFGYIAQQVKEVMPSAVMVKNDFIPNVLSMCEVSGNVIQLPEGKSVNLNLTDTNGDAYAMLKTHMANEEDFTYVKVCDTTEEGHLVMENELDMSNLIVGEEGQQGIFVWGQEVDDFHTLDKSAIFTLSTSAIQELDRRQEAQTTKIADLEARLEALEASISIS